MKITESFFWVLFWICVHYTGPNGQDRETDFESWNYENTTKLAEIKKGIVVLSKSCTTNDCNESLPFSCPRPGGYAAKAKYNKIGGPAPPVPFGSVSSPPQFHGMIATSDTADHTCLKSTALCLCLPTYFPSLRTRGC